MPPRNGIANSMNVQSVHVWLSQSSTGAEVRRSAHMTRHLYIPNLEMFFLEYILTYPFLAKGRGGQVPDGLQKEIYPVLFLKSLSSLAGNAYVKCGLVK